MRRQLKFFARNDGNIRSHREAKKQGQRLHTRMTAFNYPNKVFRLVEESRKGNDKEVRRLAKSLRWRIR